MKKLYFLNEEEKQRILNMHKSATKRNYLNENNKNLYEVTTTMSTIDPNRKKSGYEKLQAIWNRIWGEPKNTEKRPRRVDINIGSMSKSRSKNISNRVYEYFSKHMNGGEQIQGNFWIIPGKNSGTLGNLITNQLKNFQKNSQDYYDLHKLVYPTKAWKKGNDEYVVFKQSETPTVKVTEKNKLTNVSVEKDVILDDLSNNELESYGYKKIYDGELEKLDDDKLKQDVIVQDGQPIYLDSIPWFLEELMRGKNDKGEYISNSPEFVRMYNDLENKSFIKKKTGNDNDLVTMYVPGLGNVHANHGGMATFGDFKGTRVKAKAVGLRNWKSTRYLLARSKAFYFWRSLIALLTADIWGVIVEQFPWLIDYTLFGRFAKVQAYLFEQFGGRSTLTLEKNIFSACRDYYKDKELVWSSMTDSALSYVGIWPRDAAIKDKLIQLAKDILPKLPYRTKENLNNEKTKKIIDEYIIGVEKILGTTPDKICKCIGSLPISRTANWEVGIETAITIGTLNIAQRTLTFELYRYIMENIFGKLQAQKEEADKLKKVLDELEEKTYNFGSIESNFTLTFHQIPSSEIKLGAKDIYKYAGCAGCNDVQKIELLGSTKQLFALTSLDVKNQPDGVEFFHNAAFIVYMVPANKNKPNENLELHYGGNKISNDKIKEIAKILGKVKILLAKHVTNTQDYQIYLDRFIGLKNDFLNIVNIIDTKAKESVEQQNKINQEEFKKNNSENKSTNDSNEKDDKS